MAKFTDTPKWRTREAYERAKATPKRKPTRPEYAVNCPTCHARPRHSCTAKRDGRPLDQAHPERIKKGKQMARWNRVKEKRMAASQERRWRDVKVSYECPICGGDHSRAEHPKPASVFAFGDEER